MKQAVAPRRPLPELWEWLTDRVAPDVAVLTEARVPKTGLPVGWSAHWLPGGIGPKRTWGTVVAARGLELADVEFVTDTHAAPAVDALWPGTVRVVDALIDGTYWATIVGIYAITVDEHGASCGHGRYSGPAILRHLAPLFDSPRGKRIIVAGDFNGWPDDLPRRRLDRLGLVDLTDHTADKRGVLDGCSGCSRPGRCGHLWTHKNGNSPNAARQQIDFILASRALASELASFSGGIQTYPDAWEMSDHAPVVAEFLR